MPQIPGLCRDCAAQSPVSDQFTPEDGRRCPECASPRQIRHPELLQLSIAHIDCDAFYATIEKRDEPSLTDKPVIVGGGRRGVVSAACYIARTYGVRSAMPMFKALKACPDAVVIKPNMGKYRDVGLAVRAIFSEYTPLVEPISLDEAFLDLTGTEKLHHASPAETLIEIVNRIEAEQGVTASIGLSYNKFLAKVASDLDKPRGFAIVGRAEAKDFLARQSVDILWGVGKATTARLAKAGITKLGQLQNQELAVLVAKYGSIGERMLAFSNGIDHRKITPHGDAKSISSETTFETDLSDLETLESKLWSQCLVVSRRLKRAGLAGRIVNLKLRTTDYRIHSRQQRLANPTQLSDIIFRHARALLAREATGKAYRLIGVGMSEFTGPEGADPMDLADPELQKRAKAERALDVIRDKFGNDMIDKGRGQGIKPPR